MAKVFASEGNARAPKGHFVVYVGGDEEMSRYFVPISYLKTPIFKQLLEKAADEYGFQSHKGIVLPCDEFTFQQIIDDITKKQF